MLMIVSRFSLFARQCPKLVLLGLLIGWVGQTHAQSSITLYGLVDIGYAYQIRHAGSDPATFPSPGRTSSEFGMASGQQSGSRWGIKGTEDLGSGLKVNFVYESAVTVNTGQSTGFTRQSTLGVVDDALGAVDMGRRVSPGTQAFAGIDPFDFSFGQSSLTSSMGSTFIRLSNMVAYTSPTFAGFNVYAGWSFDTGLRQVNSPESAAAFGTSNKFRALSVGTRYAIERLLLSAMYDAYYSPAGANSAVVKQWSAGGTYDFQVLKLHGAYGQSIGGRVNGPGVLGNLATTGGDTNTNGAIFYRPGSRTNQWMVGVTVPMGVDSKVFASVQQQLPGASDKSRNRTTQTTASVGYTYAFSKRTDLYAFYSYMNAPEMFKEAKSQGMGVGMRHSF